MLLFLCNFEVTEILEFLRTSSCSYAIENVIRSTKRSILCSFFFLMCLWKDSDVRAGGRFKKKQDSIIPYSRSKESLKAFH